MSYIMKEGGSVTEFEKIYRTYFKDVFLYILRLSNDEHTAEEITSETFYKAMRSINKFRGECDIRVWLCQIAKNCYYTHLKKSGKSENIEYAELVNMPAQDEPVEERLFRQDEVAQIQKILHDISNPYKEVFMWRAFAELNYKQIGHIFGQSENWACVTYHRARKMIKERLENGENEK